MQINYFEILRSYNELKIAKRVGAKANSLFYAILGKFNTLRYPQTITIFNSELLDLSGLTKDELNPARNKLLQVQINNQYIMKYISKGTRKPGVYEINFNGFETYFNEVNNYWLEKTINNNTNYNTNSDTNLNSNIQQKSERLIGKSDTLLTKHNKTKLNKIYKEKDNVFVFFQENGFGAISSYIKDQIDVWIDESNFDEPESIILHAMKLAVEKNARNWGYVNRILLDWTNRNLKSLNDVKAHQEQFWQNKQNKQPKQQYKDSVKRQKVPNYILNQPSTNTVPDVVDPEKSKRINELLRDLGEV